jgi:ribosomal protein L32
MGDTELIKCNQCGNEVPRLHFCVRCGHTLDDEYRGEKLRRTGAFAAHPDEPVRAIAVVSTLFPQLPRADMHVFRWALLAGTGLMIGLALIGAFPVAIVTAAVIVPLVTMLYLWDVDVYEDEPLIILGATLAWGAIAGAIAALIAQKLPSATSLDGIDAGNLLVAGVIVPIVSGALMLAGPLFLLPWRRFNDVLDGATFGGASAVAFVGAQTLVASTSMFGGGLRPGGDPVPWATYLVGLGVLEPIIAASAVGGVAAAFWLRWRAPVSDRRGLGPAGHPLFAVVFGATLLVIAGLARAALGPISQVLVLLAAAAIGLFWLRTVLHFGLLQESRELEIGPPIRCPNCGQQTPRHTFCGNCGISLLALPRRARRAAPPAEMPAETPQP